MAVPILTVVIQFEGDVVIARQRARQIAALLGFDRQDQTRTATAVSEIARNAFNHAGGGQVEFLVDEKAAPPLFLSRVTDHGPGIANLQEILAGQQGSPAGLGLVSARRMMDDFRVESSPGRGTTVLLGKRLPKGAAAITPTALAAIAEELARSEARAPFAELQHQNQELLRTLDELRSRQEELTRLNSELEDTNRGVVALYAELDEKAEQLQRANEMKTRFLSNMGHEFRTPVNSILALSQLLLSRSDGELTEEQEKQVTFIREAAGGLSDLVNDLLDLAKVEAGKVVVRPEEFEVANLVGALRGMFRPLVPPGVTLVFDEPKGLPLLYTDEGKVSQILRNFVSNALKFTEKGEVRVSAALDPDQKAIIFSVADTGIGITNEDLERIFEEFAQAENPMQQRTKGTGLGLPLARKLAELLGGGVRVTSTPGCGSVFSATIPLEYTEAPREEAPAGREDRQPREPISAASRELPDRILIVDDDEMARYVLRKMLAETPYRIIEAANGAEGLRRAREEHPRIIFLDLMMPEMSGFEVLERLRSDPVTRDLPVIIVTSKLLEERERRLIDRENAVILSKANASRETVLSGVRLALSQAGPSLNVSEGVPQRG